MIRLAERWLIEWSLGLNPTQEPLYGDLIEELGNGRSRLWFWRQLVYAAGTTAARVAWATRRDTAERWALGSAMLAVLVFQGYVAAKLGIVVASAAWTTLFPST
jgi:hypothetical protein